MYNKPLTLSALNLGNSQYFEYIVTKLTAWSLPGTLRTKLEKFAIPKRVELLHIAPRELTTGVS